MKHLRSAIFCFAMLLLVTSALAQGGGQGRRRGGFGNGAGAMLSRDDVLKELKLTDDQKAKLQEVQDQVQQERRDLFQSNQGDFSAIRAQMDKKQPAWDAKEVAVLTPDQVKRLKGLMIQKYGNSVLLQEMFQKDLGITTEQKSKINDLQKKRADAMQTLGEKTRSQEITFEEMRAAMEKNDKILNDEIEKILTDSQKSQLKQMAGTPFKFDEDNGGF